MNINFEKMPSFIFDWMEKSSFEKLNGAQQKEVLAWFSAEEYDEMYKASKDLKAMTEVAFSVSASEKKSDIMTHFDKQISEKRSLVSSGVIFWQAAAILLLVLSGWLFYQMFDLKNQVVIEQVALIDTVYVDREVASTPELIHDTVYKYEKVEASSKSNKGSNHQVLKDEEPTGDMEIAPAAAIENIPSVPRGNSMKDDSLLRKFGFVAM